jgi:membrane associated rhomboid family serine protease
MIPLRDARPAGRTPVVTAALIVACVVVFAWELAVLAADGDAGLERMVTAWGLDPAALASALGRGAVPVQTLAGVFTSTFLHAGWLHLGGNMLYLWIFGSRLEDRLGRVRFLLLYLLGAITAAVGQTLVDPATGPVIGASGAISGVLGAYLVLFPRARIQSLVFLGFFYQMLAVPAVIVLGLWFVLQLVAGLALLADPSVTGGVAVFAHIGGFVGGLIAGFYVRLRAR